VCVHSCVGTFTVTLATKLLSPSGCGGILPLQARQCHRQRHVTTYLNDLPLLHSHNRLTSTIYVYSIHATDLPQRFTSTSNFIFTQPTYLNDLPLLHSHNRLTSTMYLYFIHTTNLPQRFTFTELPQRFIHITVFIVKRWALAYVAESQTG
jgi:hypothetical protein